MTTPTYNQTFPNTAAARLTNIIPVITTGSSLGDDSSLF